MSQTDIDNLELRITKTWAELAALQDEMATVGLTPGPTYTTSGPSGNITVDKSGYLRTLADRETACQNRLKQLLELRPYLNPGYIETPYR